MATPACNCHNCRFLLPVAVKLLEEANEFLLTNNDEIEKFLLQVKKEGIA